MTDHTYDEAHATAIADLVLELHAHRFQGVGYEGDFTRGDETVRILWLGTHVSSVELFRGRRFIGSAQVGTFDSPSLAMATVRRLMPPGSR